MKLAACHLLVIGLLFLRPLVGRCQQRQLAGQVTDSKLGGGFPGVTITVHQAGKIVAGTITNRDGAFSLSNLPVGTYDVVVEMLGYRAEGRADVEVTAQPTALTIPFPGPCQYRYQPPQLPLSVGGHTDHFIPIVYGLPTAHTRQRAKRGKIYLGGCQVTGCDPHYYCPIHQKQL